MQYSKDAVIAAVKKRLAQIEAGEESNHQGALRARQKVRDEQEDIRDKLFAAFEQINALGAPQSGEDFRQLERILGNVAPLENGYSIRSGSEYFGQYLKKAAMDWTGEPEKNTEASDSLRAALEVFETGAPPTVGVRDLQAFGLMSIVKYGK